MYSAQSLRTPNALKGKGKGEGQYEKRRGVKRSRNGWKGQVDPHGLTNKYRLSLIDPLNKIVL